nr:kinetochore protein Nuf2 [Cryptomonas curvata]
MENSLSEIKLINYSQENIFLLTENFIEIFTGKKIEKLYYPKSFILETFDYPELHEESVSFLIINRKLQYIMFSIGVEDFSINDYINPNVIKNRKIVMALNNFSVFRKNQIFILNKTGFNLKKVNIECYLTLNRLLINKYKIKFIKNIINTNCIYIKILKKKIHKTSYFVGIFVQLCFFFSKKNYFIRKAMAFTKILFNIKSIMLIRNNKCNRVKKNYIISKIKKEKNIIIQLFRLYKFNIFLLSPIIYFLYRILNFLILIANVIKVYLQFHFGYLAFCNTCVFKVLTFPKWLNSYKKLFIFHINKKKNKFNVNNEIKKNKRINFTGTLSLFDKEKKNVIFFFQ